MPKAKREFATVRLPKELVAWIRKEAKRKRTKMYRVIEELARPSKELR